MLSVYRVVSTGEHTVDNVFLLSNNEAGNYFNKLYSSQCESTTYAFSKYKFGNEEYRPDFWWLRSNSFIVETASPEKNAQSAFVNTVNMLGFPSYMEIENSIGVRPSIWVNLSAMHAMSIDVDKYPFNNVLFVQNRLHHYPPARKTIEYNIPYGTVAIDQYAFWYNNTVETIIIPNTVTTIEGCAFFGCKRLQRVFIPSSVTQIDSIPFQPFEDSPNVVLYVSAGSYAELWAKENNVCFMVTESVKGFQSDVTVNVGLNIDNTIAILEIISSGETQGFGTRCSEDKTFLNQFIGKTAPFVAGLNVDVVVGATVTSNAVIEALNNVVPAVASDVLAATAKGFQSDVTVKVTLNEDGAIATLTIESAGETQGFGTRCGEDEVFAAQFIGQKAPFTADMLSGATVTSNAVIEALTSLFAAEKATAAEELTATAEGFQSDVTVKVTLNEDGTIAILVIESANETLGFGTRCGEDEAFAAQFIGKKAPFTVDVLSGATVTSNAVIEALTSLFSVEELTATAKGFQSDVTVKVTLNEDGTIATLSIDSAGETKGFGTRCAEEEAFISQFIGQKAPFNFDVVSGATVTSNAVVEALNSLFQVATLPASEEATATVRGFQSDITVKMTLNEDGTIATLTVDSAGETQGFGTRCGKDEAFIRQFVGQKAPFHVEVLSGATVTSNAVIEAVSMAVASALDDRLSALFTQLESQKAELALVQSALEKTNIELVDAQSELEAAVPLLAEVQAEKDLAAACSYLRLMYKNATETTPADYTVVGVVKIGENEYAIDWSVDNEAVKIVVGEDKMVTIDVDNKTPEEVAYVLTATLKNAYGAKETVSFKHKVPAALILEGLSYEEIVAAAYTLEDGLSMDEAQRLFGTVVKIDTPWSPDYQNITVTIRVGDLVEQPIMCYRLSGEGAENLAIGDEITVEGIIKNYKGTIEFDKGCQLVGYGQHISQAAILDAAYALEDGAFMPAPIALKGVISKIDTVWSEDYQNITVTIVCDGKEEQPIMCYRLTGEGAKYLAVGDTITVTGTLKNYKGTIEFDKGCTLNATIKAK